MRELCSHYDVLLIADEVFTGCGRTGKFYACEHAQIMPDIMVLSKGLSGGYFPFAATLSTQKVFDAFYSDDRNLAFLHGHSMTANPLACASAWASLTLFEKEDSLAKVKKLETLFQEHLHFLQHNSTIAPFIQATRCLGAVAAIELKSLVDSDKAFSYTNDLPWAMMSSFLEKGVLIRPLGNVIYLTPPYCISEDELDKVFKVIEEVVSSFYL